MAFQWTSNYQFSAPSGASGISVTPSGVAWANSAWAEIHPGTDSPWVLTSVILGDRGTTAPFEVDIGVVPVSGAISGCTAIATVKGIVATTSNYSHAWMPLAIPINNIPASYRVGVRMRKSGTSTTAWSWAIQFLKTPITGNLQTTTQRLRPLPSAAAGVNCPAGATAYTYGAWTVISASAPANMVIAGLGLTSPYNGANFELQIGKGAVSSEVALFSIKGYMSVTTVTPGYQMLANPCSGVSSGDRIVARFRKEGTNTTGPDVHIVYYETPL
jgi:hypothetical protein